MHIDLWILGNQTYMVWDLHYSVIDGCRGIEHRHMWRLDVFRSVRVFMSSFSLYFSATVSGFFECCSCTSRSDGVVKGIND
jgi:hypothetical protein